VSAVPLQRPDRPRLTPDERRRIRARRRRIAAAVGCGPLFRIAWGLAAVATSTAGWLVHYCQPPAPLGHFFDGLQLLVPHPDPDEEGAERERGL
jgi:hypothetical protein